MDSFMVIHEKKIRKLEERLDALEERIDGMTGNNSSGAGKKSKTSKTKSKSKSSKSTKKKLNPFMKLMTEAKASEKPSFEYKGKTYVRHAHPTFGSVYKSK